MISITDEFSALKTAIIGLASPYQRDKARVAAEMNEFPFVPDTARKAEVIALAYPDEDLLEREYADYVATLGKYGVEVLRADADAAYSFDYTCPRDIGFVIGDQFFVANMAVASRAVEIRTIEHHLHGIESGRIVHFPEGALIEGGDVIVLDSATVLVGMNQRSNRQGYEFLRALLAQFGIEAIALRHRQLHLDCCLNPLGKGHLLIHPGSLVEIGEPAMQVLRRYDWIPVDDVEREHLATNVLSIDRETIVARDHAACARVNRALRDAGYAVEAIGFDGVPATGGSFRCASLALSRRP